MDPPIRDSESKPKPLSKNKDDANVVFIDTNLDTHLAVLVSDHDTVSDLKERILSEHASCFPKLGQIQIHAMKVKRKEYFYHLFDSMFVKSAFYGFNKSWFLCVDASPLGERGQNDCSGSRSQKILHGNSDNALTGLINDEKGEHDFVNPSDKAVKDDNVVCEDERSKSVSSAKEKQKSTRKEDDTPEYDASVFRPGNDTVQREIEVMADPSLNATKEVIIESEVLKEHQHNEFNESGVGLTDRAEGRREVLQDDPKPMQLEECTPSEQNNNTEANIKESNVAPKPVDMNEMGEPVKSEKKKRRKRKDMDLDESASRKECTPSKQNNTDANVNDLNVTSKVVLGIEKSEKKKRKARKDKDSNVETTIGEGIGPTDASDSKIVIVKSLKSSDCNPALADIGAEENPLNHTEVGIIQQAEMKGTVVSAIEKDDASGADNPGSLEQIETIANAEHVDKTRRKKSNKKQSTKSKSSSNMLTNDVNPASGDIGAEENPSNHTEVGIIQQAEMKGTVVSATEKDDASGADNPGSLEQIETIANAEHVDKTRRKKSNKKQSTKSKSSSNMLTNDVNDSQKPSPSSDFGTLASPNVSLFPSNTAEGIDNLAPVEANDAAKDSTFSCEEKDEKNLEASLEDDRVNVEQQSPSQQVQHRSHLDKMVPNVRKTKRDAKLSSQSNSDLSSIREKGKPRANASGKSMDSADHLPISSPTMKGSKKVIHKKAGKSLVNNASEDSHGGKRLESGEQNDFNGSMSTIKGKPIDHVFRRSSRYKKARITEFVPDSLAE